MKKKGQQHLFSIFGIDVNLSSILTTVVGFIVVTLITTTIAWVKDINKTLVDVKREQERVKAQYQPEIKKQ